MAERRCKLRPAHYAGLSRCAGRRRAGRMPRSRDLLVSRIVTAAARLVRFPADRRTRRRLRLMLDQVMAERRRKYRAADAASLSGGTSCRGAGDVTLCRGNDGAANRADLVLRARRIRAQRMALGGDALRARLLAAGAGACLDARRRTRRGRRLDVLAPIVAERGDLLLRRQHGVAAGAMAPLRLAGGGASCRLGRIRHGIVPEGIHAARLCLLAAGASACLLARRRARRGRRLDVLTPTVPERGDLLLRRQHGVAAGAMAPLRLACRRTSCGYRRIRHGIVPERIHAARLCCLTAGASARLLARRRARRGRRLNVLAPGVPQCGHGLLRLDDRLAPRAMAARGKAGLRAGRRYGRIRRRAVTQRRDRPRRLCAAHRASRRLHAHCRTRRRGRLDILSPIMPRRGDLLLRRQYGVAAGAMAALRLAGCGASRRLGRIRHGIVPEGRRKLSIADSASLSGRAGRRRAGRMTLSGSKLYATSGAGLSGRTCGRRTGRMARGCDLLVCRIIASTRRHLRLVLNQIMAERGHCLLRCNDRSAAGAMAALRLACRRACCRDRRIRHRAVPQRRDRPRRRGATARASCRLRTRRRTSRGFGRRIAAIVMAQRRRLIARIAVAAAAAIMIGIAARGARCAVIRCAHIVAQRRCRSRRRVAAAAAGPALGAARGTRRR